MTPRLCGACGAGEPGEGACARCGAPATVWRAGAGAGAHWGERAGGALALGFSAFACALAVYGFCGRWWGSGGTARALQVAMALLVVPFALAGMGALVNAVYQSLFRRDWQATREGVDGYYATAATVAGRVVEGRGTVWRRSDAMALCAVERNAVEVFAHLGRVRGELLRGRPMLGGTPATADLMVCVAVAHLVTRGAWRVATEETQQWSWPTDRSPWSPRWNAGLYLQRMRALDSDERLDPVALCLEEAFERLAAPPAVTANERPTRGPYRSAALEVAPQERPWVALTSVLEQLLPGLRSPRTCLRDRASQAVARLAPDPARADDVLREMTALVEFQVAPGSNYLNVVLRETQRHLKQRGV